MKENIQSISGVLVTVVIIFFYIFGIYKSFDEYSYPPATRVAVFLVPPYAAYIGVKESYYYLTTTKYQRRARKECVIGLRISVREFSASERIEVCQCAANQAHDNISDEILANCFREILE